MHARSGWIAVWMICMLADVVDSHTMASCEDQPTSDTEKRISLKEARSPKELAARLAKLTHTSTGTELDRLVSASDCGVALAAGWERVLRTMPEKEQKQSAAPDPPAISRFLGLVEGRLRVSIPKSWGDALHSAGGYSQKHISFNVLDPAFAEHRAGDWLLRQDGADWLLERGWQSIKLRAELEIDLLMVTCGTVERAGERAYVAVYSSLPESKYSVFAINQRTGHIRWSAEAWGSSRVWPPGLIVGYSGHYSHAVTMRSTDETLVVFGISDNAVYVEVFDRLTGENRCRFSTAYFDDFSNWESDK
jgi:hypothetical protein